MFKRKKKGDNDRFVITDKEKKAGITSENAKNFLTIVDDINHSLNRVKANPYLTTIDIKNDIFTFNVFDKGTDLFITSKKQLLLFASVPVKVVTGSTHDIEKWYINHIVTRIDRESKEIKETIAHANDTLYTLSNYKRNVLNYLKKQEKKDATKKKETEES